MKREESELLSFRGHLLRKHFYRITVYSANRGVSVRWVSNVDAFTLCPDPKQGLDDASRIIGRAVMTII